ncbi:MAG: cell division protein FtsL [Neisseria sp.]|nr:cell division protein FtsL [Neisseria sp.]
MNFINTILLIITFVSGLAAVTVQNTSRERFTELSQVQKAERELEKEYASAKLQQAQLSNLQRIRQATERLNLQAPSAANTQIVETK